MKCIRLILGLTCVLIGFCMALPQNGYAHGNTHRNTRGNTRSYRTKMSITPTPNNVFLMVKLPRHRFRKLSRRGWQPVARLWIRRSTGWVRIGRRILRRRRWTRGIATGRICRGSFGKVKLVLQMGVRNGRFWWNRYARKWQSSFISIRQSIAWIQCPPVPDDMPPGTPKGIGSIVAPAQPNTPSQHDPFPPTAPAQPTQPPPVQSAPTQPEPSPSEPNQAPPPPPVVPTKAFLSFHSSMKDASFDNGRYKMLKSWLRRLQSLRLRPGHIYQLLKTFSFDSTRTKAAIRMSRYVLRPLKVQQVIRIIKPFSFGSSKLKAALYYCRGLEDPLNIHLLAKQFNFSRSKRKIMRRCR